MFTLVSETEKQKQDKIQMQLCSGYCCNEEYLAHNETVLQFRDRKPILPEVHNRNATGIDKNSVIA